MKVLILAGDLNIDTHRSTYLAVAKAFKSSGDEVAVLDGSPFFVPAMGG